MGHSLGSTKCWRFKRAPSLSRISFGFLYLLEMFKHLNILSGYPLDQLRSCWHSERAMVTVVLSTHSLLVAHTILRPAPHVHPFSLCQRVFFPPGALSSVGCQRTCQEEKIPCWCKSRSSPGQWRVCSVLGWEGLGVTQNSGSVSPSHTKKNPWTLSTNSTNSI